MNRLLITSLRKSAGLLAEAVQAWRDGAPLALPSECGYFVLGAPGGGGSPRENIGPGGLGGGGSPPENTWLSATAPPCEDAAVAAVAEVFWPGPLRLRLPSAQGKQCWQVPAHPLAQALLSLTGPVTARFVGAEPVLEGMVLVWKEPCLNLSFSEVDCACTPWRWLRSGLVDRRELEWVAQRPTVLSGRALPNLPMETVQFQEPQFWRIDP